MRKFDRLCDHPIREDLELRSKVESALKDLVSLERHFRLAKAYRNRNRAIAKNFEVLGSDWTRITHDAKNPLVIGLGGIDGGMTGDQKRHLGISTCVGTMLEYGNPEGGAECKKAFVINLSKNVDKNSYATLQHLWHSIQQSPIKEILSDTRRTKLEVTFDNAPNYISKYFLYGCTKGIHQLYPHLKIIRYVPLCPLHGKSDLDRRFSSLTSWISTYQHSKRIESIPKMRQVLEDGHAGSNLQRRELGEPLIPMSFNILELTPRPEFIPYVSVSNIKSILCVTFITNSRDRLRANHSGWYINVYPWIFWKRGMPVMSTNVFEGDKGLHLTEEERALKGELKESTALKDVDFKRLQKKYDNRCAILRKLGINLKNANSPVF